MINWIHYTEPYVNFKLDKSPGVWHWGILTYKTRFTHNLSENLSLQCVLVQRCFRKCTCNDSGHNKISLLRRHFYSLPHVTHVSSRNQAIFIMSGPEKASLRRSCPLPKPSPYYPFMSLSEMIPNPEMIPKSTPKWYWPGNDLHFSSHRPRNVPQLILGMEWYPLELWIY